MISNRGRKEFSNQEVQHLQFCYAETEDLVYLSFHWLPWHLADPVCLQTEAALHLAAHPPEANRKYRHVIKLPQLSKSVTSTNTKKNLNTDLRVVNIFTLAPEVTSKYWVKFNYYTTELLQLRKQSFNLESLNLWASCWWNIL